MKATICLALLAAGIVLSAQQQSPRPTFRAGINAVVVDVRVVDRDGRFIRDLDKDDFQVFEDDQEQTITTFDLIDVPAATPAGDDVDQAVTPVRLRSTCRPLARRRSKAREPLARRRSTRSTGPTRLPTRRST